MRIITPTYEIWKQEEGLEGIFKQIERAGRICYASDPIEGKAKDFVDRMIKSGHGAMLEHGTVYLTMNVIDDNFEMQHDLLSPDVIWDYQKNKFSIVNISNEVAYITTNLRVLAENDWLEDLQYLCEPTEYHEKRITVKFSTQIAISREYNRHKVNSIAEQSTRYCNYGKDKFGNEISINLPSFVDLEDCHFGKNYSLLDYCNHISEHSDLSEGVSYFTAIDYWWFANLACEFSYLNMIRLGAKPQEARTILPLDTNSELVHTAFVSDWKHFFNLRALGTTGRPHPDCQILATSLMENFKTLGLL